jgi:hypothetical protein
MIDLLDLVPVVVAGMVAAAVGMVVAAVVVGDAIIL